MLYFFPLLLFVIVGGAGLAFRRFSKESAWLDVASDLALVLVAFLAGLAVVFTFPALVELETATSPGIAVSSALLPALPVALFIGRARRFMAAAVIFALGFIAWGDAIHWRFFQALLPFAASGSAVLLWDIRESIEALMQAKDFALLPFLGVSLAIVFLWPRPRGHRPRLGLALSFAAAAIALIGFFPVVNDVKGWMEHRFSWKVFKWDGIVSEIGVIATHARDFARTLREQGQTRELTKEELADLSRFAEERDNVATYDGFGVAKGMNVLVVQVEAMQRWVIDAESYGVEVMPFLQSLKRDRALFYDHVWDQTGASPTSDCEYAVLNSQHPLDRGSVAFRRADNDFVTVPKLLAREGYSTFSAHAFDRGMWNRAVVHPRYGFQRSDFRRELGDGPKVGWGISDKLFFERVVDRLDAIKEPWFTFLITLTTHHPYHYTPPKERGVAVKVLSRERLGGYLWSMRYIDDALRQLFADLDEAGLLDHTVVVIYGDHDSKLTFGQGTIQKAKEALNLDDTTLKLLSKRDWRTKKVPLFIVLPKGERKGVVTTVGGQIDIGPTILHYLGVRKSRAFLGHPMLGQEGMTVRHDGSGVSNRHVWFSTGANGGRCQTFDGKNVDARDCGYLSDLAARELQMSWTITLQNLAKELDAKTPTEPSPLLSVSPEASDEEHDANADVPREKAVEPAPPRPRAGDL